MHTIFINKIQRSPPKIAIQKLKKVNKPEASCLTIVPPPDYHQPYNKRKKRIYTPPKQSLKEEIVICGWMMTISTIG
jgi:hypothetical protein